MTNNVRSAVLTAGGFVVVVKVGLGDDDLPRTVSDVFSVAMARALVSDLQNAINRIEPLPTGMVCRSDGSVEPEGAAP